MARGARWAPWAADARRVTIRATLNDSLRFGSDCGAIEWELAMDGFGDYPSAALSEPYIQHTVDYIRAIL